MISLRSSSFFPSDNRKADVKKGDKGRGAQAQTFDISYDLTSLHLVL